MTLIKQHHHHHHRFDTIQECLFDEERMDKLRKQAASEFMYMDDPEWPKFSILFNVIKFLKQRIAKCTEKCIVCDKPHPLQLLKPVACDNPLCNYQVCLLGNCFYLLVMPCVLVCCETMKKKKKTDG